MDALPGPWWVAYAAAFLALTGLGLAARWLDGGVPVGDVPLLTPIEASFPPIFLLVLGSLDSVALRSLRTLRPALTISEPEIDRLAKELVTTPPWWAITAVPIGIAAAIVSVASDPAGYSLGPGTGPVILVWEVALTSLTYAAVFGLTAHALHQLQLVTRVHRDAVRVELFQLEPLYSFANLTSWTGIILVALATYSIGTLSFVAGIEFSAVDLVTISGLVVFAVASFVVPLLGLHSQIGAEKAERRAAAAMTLATVVNEVQTRIRAAGYEQMSQLNDALAAATSALATISKVSTWPWRPETVRGFFGAVGLPVLIWTITAFLGRYV